MQKSICKIYSYKDFKYNVDIFFGTETTIHQGLFYCNKVDTPDIFTYCYLPKTSPLWNLGGKKNDDRHKV